MPRLLPIVVLSVALTVAACSGSSEPAPPPPPTTGSTATTPSSTSASSPPPTTSVSPTPVVDPDIGLPADLQPTVDDPAVVGSIAAGDLTALVPPGASYANRSTLVTPRDPIDQIVLTWEDGAPPVRRTGLVVWQRFAEEPTWRAVYAFTNPPSKGVFGIRVETGDLTGDRIDDLLSFEDVGGSGACGTYRVVTSTSGDATEILRRDTCDTQLAISGGDLRVREAVFHAEDPHCCPSAFRLTTLRWNGSSWDEISSVVVPSGSTGR